MRPWIAALGNKKNTNSGCAFACACPLARCDGACASRKAAGRISDGAGAGLRRKREKKVKRDKAPTKWEDMLGQEKGIVISDLGTSFHGIIASTGA